MDKNQEQDTGSPPEADTVFRSVHKELVQTELRLRVWDCHVDGLPTTLTCECSNTRLMQRLYYPYWRLGLDATVKTLCLPPRQLRFSPSVDAVTGQLCVVMARDKTSVIDTQVVPTYVVPNAVARGDIDSGRVYQAVRVLVSRRIRSWSNLRLSIQDGVLIHKRIDLYAVTPKHGPELLIALDTISGEYGIVDATARN